MTFFENLLLFYYECLKPFLTIGGYFFDPIEQYDLVILDFLNPVLSSIYLYIILMIFALICLTHQIDLSIFSYIQFRFYNFLKEAFLSVCGSDKQILFPYFYYIFLFLLFSNVLGMVP